MKTQFLCLTAVLCMAFAGTANASLVTGGGFNDAADLALWTPNSESTTSNAAVFGELAPIEGASYLRFTGRGGMGFAEQTVDVMSGGEYKLTFSFGGGDDSAANGVGVNVTIDSGGSLADTTYAVIDNTFTSTMITFTAGADMVTIRFSEDSIDSDGQFAAVDGVSLTNVPEPTSMLLFGIAAVGLPLVRRRK